MMVAAFVLRCATTVTPTLAPPGPSGYWCTCVVSTCLDFARQTMRSPSYCTFTRATAWNLQPAAADTGAYLRKLHGKHPCLLCQNLAQLLQARCTAQWVIQAQQKQLLAAACGQALNMLQAGRTSSRTSCLGRSNGSKPAPASYSAQPNVRGGWTGINSFCSTVIAQCSAMLGTASSWGDTWHTRRKAGLQMQASAFHAAHLNRELCGSAFLKHCIALSECAEKGDSRRVKHKVMHHNICTLQSSLCVSGCRI